MPNTLTEEEAAHAIELSQALQLGIAMGYEDRLEEIIDEVTALGYSGLQEDGTVDPDEEPDFNKTVTLNEILTLLRSME